MAAETPNRIAELRKLKGMTQQALAEAVGSHWITISKLERGKLPLSFEWAEKLGKALGVGEFAVFKQNPSSHPIFVDGLISEGGKASYFSDGEGKEGFETYHVDLDLNRRGGTYWFVIDNDGFFPFFQTNDLIQVEWVSPKDPSLFLNRLCLVDIKYNIEDKGELRLGFVVNSSKRNLYNLNILSGAPIKNLELSGIGVVTMALFNPPVWNARSGRSEEPEA